MMSSKDLNFLKELGEKIPDIEMRLETLFKLVPAMSREKIGC